MKIATWNVNSIRARIENLKKYLKSSSPDIILLQEIKTEEHSYPLDDLKTLGYLSYVNGQKSYNGVSILSKKKLDAISTDLPGDKIKKSKEENSIILSGDFNITPEEIDVYEPKKYINDALFKLEVRKRYRKLVNLGLNDSFRNFNKKGDNYTFWDYMKSSWQKNNGLRIDHMLISNTLIDLIKNVEIKINNLIKFKLLYDKNYSLTKKIKLEQLKNK